MRGIAVGASGPGSVGKLDTADIRDSTLLAPEEHGGDRDPEIGSAIG